MLRKILLFLIFPCFIYGQDTTFDFGNISFSLSTKPMSEGYIYDISLGYMYTDRFFGDVLFRNTTIIKNDEFKEDFIEDSLLALDERTYQLYLLPFGFWRRNASTRFMAGVGLYYEHINLNEKGFFDAPYMENYRVNSFTNEFLVHLVGPLFDLKFNYLSQWFNIGFQTGIVPIFFLKAEQKRGIIPLTENIAEFSQQTSGSPYFYLGADIVLFKYVNVGLMYDVACLRYQLLDLDNNGNWIHPELEIVNQSFRVEASALIPISGDLMFQAGYGFIFNTITTPTGDIKDNKNYLILSTRKLLL